MTTPHSSSDTPQEGALRTRGLAVGYRTRRVPRVVLDGLNLSVRRGDLVCLLGANGTGKSTLLRTIARMQPPLAGSVELDAVDLASLSQVAVARRLGAVLTERVVVDALTARCLVEWGRYPHTGWFGDLTDRDHHIVAWAIDVVGARHLAERHVTQLSDGERQRVMIARALAQEPSVLVLDEPTAFLDMPSRMELMVLLRRLARVDVLAIVASTHDVDLALRLADAIWLVTATGEVLAGAPEDLVLSGAIAAAFDGGAIQFDPSARHFSVRAGDRLPAQVRGSGVREAMARAVLEREGYVAQEAGTTACVVAIETHEFGWRAVTGNSGVAGSDFASLAAFLRGGLESYEKHQHNARGYR